MNSFFLRLRSIGQNRRGTAIIEFSLVAAPLLALLLATLATSLVFFAQEGIETATEAAARSIMTGTAKNETDFRTAACDALPPYLSCGALITDVRTATSFETAEASSPGVTYNNGAIDLSAFHYSPGGANSIVVVRLMYVWPVPSGPLSFSLATLPDGKRLLVATSIAKSEGYS